MATLVALLRGINVGGHNRVSMAELRERLEGLGYEDVRTLLQSGNVVLKTRRAPATVAGDVGGPYGVEVVVRTGEELAGVVAAEPFGDVARDPKRHFVGFLGEGADAAAVRELVAPDYGTERLAAGAREVYAWCPDGVQGSRAYKALLAARLGAPLTVRNWNTVTKLLDMART